MKTIILLLVLTIPLGAVCQYNDNVKVYGLEQHKKRKTVARILEAVGASGLITYAVMQHRYKQDLPKYQAQVNALQSSNDERVAEGTAKGWNPKVIERIEVATADEIRYLKSQYACQPPKILLPAAASAVVLGVGIEMASLKKLRGAEWWNSKDTRTVLMISGLAGLGYGIIGQQMNKKQTDSDLTRIMEDTERIRKRIASDPDYNEYEYQRDMTILTGMSKELNEINETYERKRKGFIIADIAGGTLATVGIAMTIGK